MGLRILAWVLWIVTFGALALVVQNRDVPEPDPVLPYAQSVFADVKSLRDFLLDVDSQLLQDYLVEIDPDLVRDFTYKNFDNFDDRDLRAALSNQNPELLRYYLTGLDSKTLSNLFSYRDSSKLNLLLTEADVPPAVLQQHQQQWQQHQQEFQKATNILWMILIISGCLALLVSVLAIVELPNLSKERAEKEKVVERKRKEHQKMSWTIDAWQEYYMIETQKLGFEMTSVLVNYRPHSQSSTYNSACYIVENNEKKLLKKNFNLEELSLDTFEMNDFTMLYVLCRDHGKSKRNAYCEAYLSYKMNPISKNFAYEEAKARADQAEKAAEDAWIAANPHYMYQVDTPQKGSRFKIGHQESYKNTLGAMMSGTGPTSGSGLGMLKGTVSEEQYNWTVNQYHKNLASGYSDSVAASRAQSALAAKSAGASDADIDRQSWPPMN